MEITDIRVKKIITENSVESKMKAVVSVTFDDAFVVHDIKVIEGQDKLFTAMPSRKTSCHFSASTIVSIVLPSAVSFIP